jgi:hypothetical protein
VSRIEEVKGFTVAVEATWYLQRILDEDSEPLLSALGGLPYGLKAEIEADLDNWNKYGVTPMFVFDGLYIIGQEDMALRIAKSASRRSDKAWESYRDAKTDQQLKDAVKSFGELGTYSRRTNSVISHFMLTETRCYSAEDVLSVFPRDSP